MEKARELLKIELSGAHDEALQQLQKIEPLYLEVCDELNAAREELTKRKAQYVLPKMGTADWTRLASTVSDLQANVDELESVKQAIQNRLDLGRALL